jgi:hypothetical protein
MLKQISAALIAISMLAAPAMAASSQKTLTTPITKSVAPAAKLQIKPSVRNANAKMGRHHHQHFRHHHARKHYGAVKTHKIHKVAKVTVKHFGSATKRG